MLPNLITSIPGPESRRLADILRKYESPNVTYLSPHFPVFWQRAEGAHVWDVDGNGYVDLTSGFGVASLGFTPGPVREAMRDQAGSLFHAMGDVHPTPLKAELCQELSRWTYETWGVDHGKTILTNSGSEAVEAALKTAWLATGRRRVLAFTGSYHGLGYGALTVTQRDYFRAPFAGQLADFAVFLPFPVSDCREGEIPVDQGEELSLERKIRHVLASGDVGAILVEPIQGRAGEIVPPAWFLPLLRRISTDTETLLIFDEIYTGFYRTGPRFACDAVGVVPDLICLGKALTSGFPLAACVGRSSVMDRAWPRSTGEAWYTSTFLGNPLGCRMALESLRLLNEKPWQEIVTALGNQIEQGLIQMKQANPHRWGRLRGRGLMRGIEILNPKTGLPDPLFSGGLIEKMLGRGYLILSGGVEQNVLSWTPPFVITPDELTEAFLALKEMV